jgi:hypothetical protein
MHRKELLQNARRFLMGFFVSASNVLARGLLLGYNQTMKIVKETLSLEELKQMALATFGNLVKAVVDVDREQLAVDAELHSDLEDGSKQKNLWGINLYPEMRGEDFIEFDSMINMRPSQGNQSRGVDDEGLRKKIADVVARRMKG